MSTKSPISNRIQNMSESATLAMTQMARDLKAKGHDVISLSIGEPDFDTPDHIKKAAKQALDDGYTKYTPVPGLPVIREAISKKFKRDNKLDYAPSQIVVSNGAKQSIANLAQVLLNPGDEVIIFAPFWVSYSDIVKLAGGVPVPVLASIDQDFKVTADQVSGAITDKTKAVLFSSPCNPTGSVYTEEELTSIAEVLAPHEDIYIISDEIYELINFTPAHCSIGTIPSVKDRVITVNGFAKGYAMTGWRLGYIGAPTIIAKACAKHQGQVTSGATAFGQVAGAHALLSDHGPSKAMKEQFEKRKHMVVELLRAIPGFKVNNPKGAFYVFPDISSYFGKSDGTNDINDATDFCMYILNNAYVSIVTGIAFGDPNCFRLSYAASEEKLREAIRRIAEAVGRLK